MQRHSFLETQPHGRRSHSEFIVHRDLDSGLACYPTIQLPAKMVVIINGEVLAEDDPRARAYRARSTAPPPASSPRDEPRAGGRSPAGIHAPPPPPAAGAARQASDPFSKFFPPGSGLGNFNTQLQNHVAPMTIGGIVVQPMLLVFLLLAFYLFGVRGAVGLVLVVFLMSRN